MSPAVVVPSRANFRDLAQLAVPSRFRHDLRDGVQFPAGQALEGVRDNPAAQDKLVRLVQCLAEGHPVHFGYYPSGCYRRLLLLTRSGPGIGRATDERGIIAHSQRFVGEKPQSLYVLRSLTLAFYPAPQHAAHYLRAGAYSLRGGPAETLPGSVGTLSLLYDASSNIAQLIELQSSVKHSNPKVRDELLADGIPLQRYYFKWPYQLLSVAFDFLNNLGITRLSYGPADEDIRLPNTVKIKSHKIVEIKAAAEGFAVDHKRALISMR